VRAGKEEARADGAHPRPGAGGGGGRDSLQQPAAGRLCRPTPSVIERSSNLMLARRNQVGKGLMDGRHGGDTKEDAGSTVSEWWNSEGGGARPGESGRRMRGEGCEAEEQGLRPSAEREEAPDRVLVLVADRVAGPVEPAVAGRRRRRWRLLDCRRRLGRREHRPGRPIGRCKGAE